MRWLEGWMGTVAGVLGLFVTFLSSLFSGQSLNMAEIYASYRGSDGTFPASEQVIHLLIGLPSITVTLLFAGVLWGVWLDLHGQRTRGRVYLLTCTTLILFVSYFPASVAAAYILLPSVPFALLALLTGIVACLRREQSSAVG